MTTTRFHRRKEYNLISFEGRPMSKLPKSARIYWFFIVAAGIAAMVGSQTLNLPRLVQTPWEYVVFALIALLFGGKKISISKRRKQEEAMSMTLGFAITFACMMRMGPATSVPIAMLGCLSSCLFPKRQKYHQLGFNLALSAIEALLAGVAYSVLNGWNLSLDPIRTFISVGVSCLLFFLVNTFGVAKMISLCTSEKVLPVWKESFGWTAPSYFASACMGALAMILFHGSTTAVLLFILPIAYFVYQAFGTHLARVEENLVHIEQLQAKQTELVDLYLATIESLALAIDAKDQFTHQHIVRVQRYAVAIAQAMGVEGEELQGVKTGALLHDIGKLGVPEYVLLKPGPLTSEEFAMIKKHPEIGATILDPVVFPWAVLPAVKYHHEKWDGTGYPEGLRGEEIPVIARIMAVADVYDALTSNRSYRAAKTHEQAVEIIRKDSGRHFDSKIVDVFLRIIDTVILELAREGIGPLAASDPAAVNDGNSFTAQNRQISKTLSELWALYEVTQSLPTGVGLKETIEPVVKKIAGIYSEATCAFLLWNPKSESLVVDSVFGLNREYFLGARTAGPASVSVRTLLSKTAFFGSFEQEDLLLSESRMTPWTPLKKAIVVPVISEGTLLGTMNVYHASDEALSEYDCQMLERVCERSAPAIYNGIRFDRTREDSFRDHLTGVHNLRYLLDQLGRACDRPGVDPEKFSLLYLDLDSFKPINDGFGHSKGDAVLRDVASILVDTVGSQGTVCRCGGDEFAVMMPDCDAGKADAIGMRLQDAIDQYDPDLSHPAFGSIHVGISVGAATFSTESQEPAALIASAELRMYAQKTERKLQQLAKRIAPSNHVSSLDTDEWSVSGTQATSLL